jgi:hypothetical protein
MYVILLDNYFLCLLCPALSFLFTSFIYSIFFWLILYNDCLFKLPKQLNSFLFSLFLITMFCTFFFVLSLFQSFSTFHFPSFVFAFGFFVKQFYLYLAVLVSIFYLHLFYFIVFLFLFQHSFCFKLSTLFFFFSSSICLGLHRRA